MGSGNPPKETTVSDRGLVTIPADVRRQLGIDAGDELRWTVDEDGTPTVEVVHQREDDFDDFGPVDVGETNAVELERESGAE